MTDPPAKRELRISTPLVLALSSGMLAIAVVTYVGLRAPDEEPEPSPEEIRTQLRVDDSTPEAVAETFYDAWRRRRWTEALAVSVGEAQGQVEAKQERDATLPRDERIVAERSWDALASAPLTMSLDRVDILPDDQYALSGTAEYALVGHPYRRRVAFFVVPVEGGYRVASMTLGEVLTALPPLFEGALPDGP